MAREVSQKIKDEIKSILSGQGVFVLSNPLSSERAEKIKAAIEKKFQIKITTDQLKAAKKFEGLYRLLKDKLVDKHLAGTQPAKRVRESSGRYYPLSYAQKRMWVLNQIEPESSFYNINFLFRAKGNLSIDVIKKCLKSLIVRHESLRTNFKEIDGMPVQFIHPTSFRSVDEVLRVVRYSDKTANTRQGKSEIINRAVTLPFKLDSDSLIRVLLIVKGQLSQQKKSSKNVSEYVLVFVLHHIIVDGWSMNLFFKEFSALYSSYIEKRKLILPALESRYIDYVKKEKDLENGPSWKKQEQFWLKEFARPVRAFSLPMDKTRSPFADYKGGAVIGRLNATTTKQLYGICKKYNAGMLALLFSIFNILLVKLSGQEEIVIGIPSANRQINGTEKIIGFFLNMLAVRTRVRTEQTFVEYLELTKNKIRRALVNEQYPLEKLIEKINPDRDMSQSTLFNTIFLFNAGQYDYRLNCEGVEVTRANELSNITNFDIKFIVTLRSVSELNIAVEFNSNLYEQATINNLIKRFKTVIREIINKPEKKISDIKIIEPVEERIILNQIHSNKIVKYDKKGVADIFTAQVKLTPQRLALLCGDKRITYCQLENRSNQFANFLRSRGAKRGDRIVIISDPDPQMMAALLAVIKCGCIYVPINANEPSGRLKAIIKDVKPRFVLGGKMASSQLKDNKRISFILVNERSQYVGDNSKPAVNTKIMDPVCIIYTSGSEGKPKGVVLNQQGMINQAFAKIKNYQIRQTDRIAFNRPFGFVASTWLYWSAFFTGAAVVLYKNFQASDIIGFFNRVIQDKISILTLPTAFLYLAVDADIKKEFTKLNNSVSLRIVTFGGEYFSRNHLETFHSIKSDSTLYFNTYGQSECSCDTLECKIPYAGNASLVPIGKPNANTQAYILDRDKNIQPINTIGELYISGKCLACGYYNNIAMTEKAFLSHPFLKGKTIFRTGDLARLLPDGNIEYIGRIDEQIRIRGNRIEPVEIEARINEYPGIKSSIVKLSGRKNGEKILVAYYTADNSIDQTSLSKALKLSLPAYMIPSHFIKLDGIPLTSSGKIDRQALPEPEEKYLLKAKYESPKTTTEKILVAFWREVLGVQKISRHDNFFDLGGHSLNAISLLSRINKRFKINLPLKNIFLYPILIDLAGNIDGIKKTTPPTIPPAPKQRTYPLSYAQKRMWVLYRLESGSPFYNVSQVRNLTGLFDLSSFRRAIAYLVKRHSSFRTNFRETDGEPVQIVRSKNLSKEDISDIIKFHDLTQAADQLIKSENIIKQYTRTPFKLESDPLLRVVVIKKSEQDHILAVVMHHIITDGWSSGVFWREMSAIYNSYLNKTEPSLPPLAVEYTDYAVWERSAENTKRLEKQGKHWFKELKGELPVLNLPTDHPRPPLQSYRGATAKITFEQEITERIKKLARQNDVTLFTLLLAIGDLWLHKLSGQDDIVTGTLRANRDIAGLENMIGIIHNNLPIRSTIRGDETFVSYLDKIKKTILSSLDNSQYPFEQLIEKLNPERDLGRNPFFTILFQVFNQSDLPENLIRFDGITTTSSPWEIQTTQFDLAVRFIELPDRLVVNMNYSTDLFTRETIEQYLTYLETLAKSIVQNSTSKISHLSLISSTEERKLLKQFSGPKSHYPQTMTIPQIFEAQVKKTPNKIALKSKDRTLTYRKLNQQANQLAHYLREKFNIMPEDIIGLMLDRSPEMIIAILAVLKAGGAYLPIDPSYPGERNKYMLNDSRAKCLISDTPNIGKLQIIKRKLQIANVNRKSLFESYPTDNPKSVVKPENLAYIIYTSGSTGRPKGIATEHRNVVNFIWYFTKKYKIDQKCVFLMKTNYCFDVAVMETLNTLAGGGQIVMLMPGTEKEPEEIIKYIAKYNITHINFTPSQLSYILQSQYRNYVGGLNNLKFLFLAGEKIDIRILNLLKQQKNGVAIINLYGTTEATIISTSNKIDPKCSDTINYIGLPIANTQIYVLDKNRRLLPPHIPGELHISGDGLARGYFNDSAKTTTVFVPHPYRKGERLYKTGDRAKIHLEGDIEILGRMDRQVKIRGFRVELDEIEYFIKNMAGINNCAAIEYQDGIAAYYATTDGRSLAKEDIVDYLKRYLPAYMIPNHFVHLKSFPLNPSGKLDRQALPEPKESDLLKAKYEPPHTGTEQVLAVLWQEVLGVKKVSRYDNFFELGGHSLKAISLLSRINKGFRTNLSLKEIFINPSLDKLSALIEDQGKAANQKDKTAAIKIPKAPKQAHYPLSHAQERIFVQYKLDPRSDLYNINIILRPKEVINIEKLTKALAFLASRHAVLRTKFKEVKGRPVQIIGDKSLVKLRIEDIPGSGDQEKDNSRKEAAIEKIIKRPFDLAAEAPLRAVLFRSSGKGINIRQKTGDTLVLSVHHIAGDQWSVKIIMEELLTVYRAYLKNEKPKLPVLAIQYKDYAEWEQSKDNQKRLKKQKNYWLSRLGENPPVTDLPLDYHKRSTLDYEKGYTSDFLDNATVKKLRQLAHNHNASLFMVLFAIANLYIVRLTGKDDIIVGTSVAHRYHPDLANLIGYLGNDIPVRTRIKDQGTFRELLIQTRKNILSDFQNGEYPLEKILDDLGGERDTRNIRLFNADFKINENNKNHPCPKDPDSGRISNQAINNDWGAVFEIYKDKTRLSCEYNAAVLKEETVRNWTADLIHLAKQVAADPGKKITGYEAVSPATREKLLYQFNNTDKYQHPTKAPHLYFEAQARKTPHKTAVAYKKQKIGYGKLNDEANKLANCLLDKGIEIGDTVAIDLGEAHYLNIPQAILAIHKAGAAAVMLDREHPNERVGYILGKSKTKAVITDHPATSYLKITKKGVPGIVRIDIANNLYEYSSQKPQGRGITGTDTAFITFTSGTTGVPKGIKVTARALVNEAYNKVAHLNIKDITAIPQNFSLVYNPALEFICASFVLGKKLIIYPPSELYDPHAVIARTEREKIKFLWLTPSVLSAYLEMIEAGNQEKTPLKDLALINLTGEKTHPGLAQRFYSLYGHITLTTDGGCTEALSYSNGIIPKDKNLQTVKEGKATRNQQVYILDNNQKPLPIGATGEIYVSGYGLANGYIDKKQTKERFLPHLFRQGETIYRTGDRGRFDHAGNLEVKGRIDDQVKIRGQRVEPAEIAETIKKIAGIGDVLVRPWEKGKNYELALACYYTAKAGYTVSAREIQAALRKEMPQFMIPAYFIALPAFPLNRNGKIDQEKLPPPTSANLLKTEYSEPKTETEKKIAQIWQEVLGVERIGRHDNFFDLGGHSLKAINLLMRINDKFKVNLSLKEIFINSSLDVLSKNVEKLGKVKNHTIPVAPKMYRYPLTRPQIFIHGVKHDLVNPFVLMKLKGKFNLTAAQNAWSDIINRHEALRSNFYSDKGLLYQKIRPTAMIKIKKIRVSAIPKQGNLEQAVNSTIEKEKSLTFDLQKDLLVRAGYIRLDNDNHLMLCYFPHIIFDEIAAEILHREFILLYRYYADKNKTKKRQYPLRKLRINYCDYLAWEYKQKFSDEINYWLDKFGEGIPYLDFVRQKPKIPDISKWITKNESGRRNSFIRIKELCRQEHVTLNIFFLAVLNILLYKITGQHNQLVSTMVSTRDNPDLHKLIGMFASNIGFKSAIDEKQKFSVYLNTVKKSFGEAMDNRHVPLGYLFKTGQLVPPRVGSVPSVFYQFRSGENFGRLGPIKGNCEIIAIPIDTKFDLRHLVLAANDSVDIRLLYHPEIIDPKFADEMARYYKHLLYELVEHPDKKISEY